MTPVRAAFLHAGLVGALVVAAGFTSDPVMAGLFVGMVQSVHAVLALMGHGGSRMSGRSICMVLGGVFGYATMAMAVLVSIPLAAEQGETLPPIEGSLQGALPSVLAIVLLGAIVAVRFRFDPPASEMDGMRSMIVRSVGVSSVLSLVILLLANGIRTSEISLAFGLACSAFAWTRPVGDPLPLDREGIRRAAWTGLQAAFGSGAVQVFGAVVLLLLVVPVPADLWLPIHVASRSMTSAILLSLIAGLAWSSATQASFGRRS